MNKSLYIFHGIILGIVSFFTGEIVTFVMLGVILIALNNINSTLKKIYLQNKDRQDK